MNNRPRTVDAAILAPTHCNGIKCCVSMNRTAVHTIELPEGHFAAMVQDRDDTRLGAITVMDRADVEAMIVLLRNAMEDAERLDAGLPTIHAAPTLERQ